MPFAIHDPDARRQLEIRAKPYFVRVTDGLHLGYRKGKLVSRWVVRRRRNGRYVTQTWFGVEPDDHLAADGRRVMSFQQMVDVIMNETTDRLCCSFCGRDHTQVAKLVAGPGVFICDRCISLCQIHVDHPQESGKVLTNNGQPVKKNGVPVFVPLSEDEERRHKAYATRMAAP